MEFCTKPKSTKFFFEVIVLTTIVFLIKVESYSVPSIPPKSISSSSPNPSESAAQNPLPGSSKKNTSQQDSVPEWMKDVSHRLDNFLSPSTLSHTDLFPYLVREISQLPHFKITGLGHEIDSRLRANQISENIVPYARALKTISAAVNHLQYAKLYRKVIRDIWPRTQPKISSPQGLSSYGLFTSEIFADPDNPLQILNKLIAIPKSELRNLKTKLNDYMKIWTKSWYSFSMTDVLQFKRYAENLVFFLNQDSIFDDLKSSWAEIQRISDSNRKTADDINDETSSSNA